MAGRSEHHWLPLPENVKRPKALSAPPGLENVAKLELIGNLWTELWDSGAAGTVLGRVLDDEGAPVDSEGVSLLIQEGERTGSRFDGKGNQSWGTSSANGIFQGEDYLRIGETGGVFTLTATSSSHPAIAVTREVRVSGQRPTSFDGEQPPVRDVAVGAIVENYFPATTLRDAKEDPVGYGTVNFIIDDPDGAGACFVESSGPGKFRLSRAVGAEGEVSLDAFLFVSAQKVGVTFKVSVVRGDAQRSLSFITVATLQSK